MKRVLVTGAAGRIGREVVPLLLSHEYQVRAHAHCRALPPEWSGEVEAVSADILNDQALDEAFVGVDVVCHLAALMPPAADDDIFRVNVEGTYRLLQAAARSPRKPRFVFASSDATYCTGWSRDAYTSPIDETAEQHPMLLYGVSKVVGERFCIHYQEMHGIPTVRLRLVWILEAPEVLDLFVGSPYKDFLVPQDAGKWDDPSLVKLPLEESGASFVEHICDVRDAAQGVLLAIDKGAAAGDTFNIAGPASFTYSEAAPWLAERLGVEAVPGRCRGIHSYQIDIQKARWALGYQPKYTVYASLEDALALRATTSLKA